jgi:hypothetical protein
MATDIEGHIGPDPAPPFVWPSSSVLAGVADDRFPVPFQQVLASGSCVFGIVSAIDHRGAEWLKTVLDQHPDIRAMFILAVFGGCPTRRHDLHELLELQTECEGRLWFRVLPMAAHFGTPVNWVAVLPKGKTATAPVLAFGPSPNFGLDGADQTQVNLVFPAEPAYSINCVAGLTGLGFAPQS